MLNIVIGAFIIIEGIYQIIKRKPFGGEKGVEKYTPESYAFSNLVGGIFLTLAGVCFVILDVIDIVYGSDEPHLWLFVVIIVIVVVGVACMYLLRKRVDVVKDNKSYAVNSSDESSDTSKKDKDHIDGYED